MWSWIVWWWKIIKQYLINCSIHGVKYLVIEQLSFVERIFWVIFCAISWWGCANMIRDVIDVYIKQPVEVTAETMYLDWVTPFPAVAFCITSNSELKKNYYKQSPAGLVNYSRPGVSQTTAEDLLKLYEEIKVPCAEYMGRCSWNNVNFNCCAEFKTLYKTGVGHCIAINSVHLEGGASAVKYHVNRTVKYGDLVIDVIFNEATKTFFPKMWEVYFFNNLQLPLLSGNEENLKIKMNPDKSTLIEFTLTDIYNEDGVKQVGIEQRTCRFRDEPLHGSIFDTYTSDTCKLEAIIGRMIKLCGCVHFFYIVPPGARVCSMAEMNCIVANKSDIVLFKTRECMGNCHATTLFVNPREPANNDPPPKGFSRVHFTLISHPSIRFRRYVPHNMLTVVVSVGSAIGLFMGASILSIFEIPYWLFIRRDRIS